MPGWLVEAIAAMREMDVPAALAHLFAALHNEMVHGEGTTGPAGVTAALAGSAEAVTAAVVAGTPAAPRAVKGKAAQED